MADRIETFDVTVPAGTAIATPATTQLSFDLGIVEKLEITVPPGPSGLVGFRIRHSSQTVIPNNAANWIIADDEKISWTLNDYPVGNKWSISAYNTDVYAHTLYLRFHVNETQRATRGAVALVPITPGGGITDIS